MLSSLAVKLVGLITKGLYAIFYAALELYLDAAVPYAVAQHSYLRGHGRDA